MPDVPPEFRKDPIVERWVIIAPNRAGRPHDVEIAAVASGPRFCPFCEGHEVHTPGEILARRDANAPNRPGWRVRVVPNQFPAVMEVGGLGGQGNLFDLRLPGYGAHDVIIESPRHVASVSDLTDQQLAEVFGVYRDRLGELKRDRRLAYGLIFKNVGAAAGASMEHIHSQLIATPMVPQYVQEELSGALVYHHRHGRCVFCDLLRNEVDQELRLVCEMPRLVALAPFASRVPYETWILPKRHGSHFENLENGELQELVSVMKHLIARLEAACPRLAYNFAIHTGPFDSSDLEHYHWHIEVLPRVSNVGGFEWGSGCYINSISPEEAAAALRGTDVSHQY